jgi:hypothetical protein
MIFFDLKDCERSFVDFAEGNDWEGIVCPVSDGHQRAGRRITPLTIEFVKSKSVDFSWTFLSDIVISEKAFKVMRDAGLTGFDVKPVKLILQQSQRFAKLGSPTLWELIVTGSGGPAHPDSQIELEDACAACGMRHYTHHGDGIIVDENRWDGSDIFVVEEYTRFVLVTQRAKAVIEGNLLTNVKFVPSHEVWKKR